MNKRERLAEVGAAMERARIEYERSLAELAPERERLVRELAEEGVGAAELARLARLTRGRVWQIAQQRRIKRAMANADE